MELTNQKPFERPDGGLFLGTIIDVVDMPNVQTSFGLKNKVRILWVLGPTQPGQKVTDSEGKPLTVAFIKNGSWNEKSELFKMAQMILNAPPPLITSTEQLAQLLLGRSNQLFITLTPNTKKAGEFYANVAGVSPLTPGQVAPVAPQGFVRQKDKPKTQAGPNGQPVQTYATPQAAAAPAVAPATAPAAQPVATPTTNVAF
jgi:hypothetical protein